MKPRILTFKADNPQLETDLFGKKQFHGLKNRNSKDFSLNNLRDFTEQKEFREPYSLGNSPIPMVSPPRSRPKYETPKRTSDYNPAALEIRLIKLDEIRKKINLKIFEAKQAPIINESNRKYVPPPRRRVSPEKFLESITYSKADLESVHSKFIPTDRNTNKMLEDSFFKPVFKTPMYTKNSPKFQLTRPFV